MIISHPENGSSVDFDWRYLDTSNNLTCPWYTIGCLEWLNTLNLKNMSIFEYGCGISTSWWKDKVKKCSGVDNQTKWSNGCFVPLLNDGITIDEKLYLEACLGDKYDIIIVDGIFRDECTEYALKSIKNGGYLIFDNWDQPTVGIQWDKTKELLKDYHSIIYKEPNHIDWKTAVFQIT